MYYLFKLLISSVLIVLISEVAKRSSFWGGILASVPLLSFMAIAWLYVETKNVEKVSELSKDIFWLVLPSLSFFLIFPVLIKFKIPFWISFLCSTIIMVIIYFGVIFIAKKIGLIT